MKSELQHAQYARFDPIGPGDPDPDHFVCEAKIARTWKRSFGTATEALHPVGIRRIVCAGQDKS